MYYGLNVQEKVPVYVSAFMKNFERNEKLQIHPTELHNNNTELHNKYKTGRDISFRRVATDEVESGWRI